MQGQPVPITVSESSPHNLAVFLRLQMLTRAIDNAVQRNDLPTVKSIMRHWERDERRFPLRYRAYNP